MNPFDFLFTGIHLATIYNFLEEETMVSLAETTKRDGTRGLYTRSCWLPNENAGTFSTADNGQYKCNY